MTRLPEGCSSQIGRVFWVEGNKFLEEIFPKRPRAQLNRPDGLAREDIGVRVGNDMSRGSHGSSLPRDIAPAH